MPFAIFPIYDSLFPIHGIYLHSSQSRRDERPTSQRSGRPTVLIHPVNNLCGSTTSLNTRNSSSVWVAASMGFDASTENESSSVIIYRRLSIAVRDFVIILRKKYDMWSKIIAALKKIL